MLITGSEALALRTDRGRSSSGERRMLGEAGAVNGLTAVCCLRLVRAMRSNGPMHRAIAMSVLMTIAVAQDPSEPAKLLLDGRVVASVVTTENYVSESPDGSAIAVVDYERQVARILDAATGTVADSTHPGEVTAIALLPNGRGYWLGRNDGTVVHVPRTGAERVFRVDAKRSVDGITCVGASVAWSSSAANRGGVIDARNGAERFATQTPFGDARRPRMFLSRDARHAGHYIVDPEQGGRRLLLLRDAMTGKELTRAHGYVSHRDRSHAFGLDCLFTAARTSDKWQLHQLNLVSMKNWVIDDELRGGHFVDLFVAPSTRYLLEGDFEDVGAVLYDLADGGAYKHVLGKRVKPVGFLGGHSRDEDLAITTSDVANEGLYAWSTKTQERVAEWPFAKGKHVRQVGSMLGGKAMWMQWWRAAKDRTIVWHVEIIRFEG